jgi:broad specificity phosphatase PhoE
MMNKVTRIYVVRHGESVFNRDQIVSGHVDPELTEAGRKQVEATKQKLAKVHFDEAYSSDLRRAIDTAEIIYGKGVPKTNRWHKLRERDFGDYDGRPSVHLATLHQEKQKYIDSPSDADRWLYRRHPSIESDHEVSTRFVEALSEIARLNFGKTVLVGAHGGTIRTMLIKLGYASAEELPGGSFENAGYVELEYRDGEFVVKKVVGTIKSDRK